MKAFLKRKRFSLLLTLLLTLMILLAGMWITYSAMKDEDQKKNRFRFVDFETTIEEKFSPPASFAQNSIYQKEVMIKNTGNSPAFIRVAVLPVFTKTNTKGERELLPATFSHSASSVLTLDLDTTRWIDGRDGYFYYLDKVASGQGTSVPLFRSVKVNSAQAGAEYEGAELVIELKVEGIHVTPFAYRDAWWQGKVPSSEPLKSVESKLKALVESED